MYSMTELQKANETIERLHYQNKELMHIVDSMSGEIIMLRAVKSTVECIFGQKINVKDAPKVGAE